MHESSFNNFLSDGKNGFSEAEGITVLSLFDGMSCGQLALQKLGIKVKQYYAAEIDKHAIQVTQHNFPNTIQLGDVTKVKIKLICLSEVYSYICNYDNNLQSNISEWEVLYWLNKNFTFSAKIGTQKPNERQEISEPSTIQRIKEVWFSNREMGSVRKFGDYTRSRSNGEENDIRTPQQLQCGKWWYDNDIYRRYKEENIGITIRKTKNGDSEKKNFGNIEGEVFKRKESESCFRENEKSNVEKRCSGELFERKREDRFSREVKKEKGNRRTKEGNFIDEVIRELCRWDESDGITQDYWSLLRLHKEEQITVVEYEGGYHIFKGKIDLLCGGSPCQGFSFAGKQLAFDDPRSKLFFEFVRLKNECNPTYFMLENVKMKKEFELIISKYMGVAPIEINSALLSAQNRVRLYWTNIANEPFGLFGDMQCMIPQPKDKGILLRDILESEVLQKYYLSDKALATVTRKRDIGINAKINPEKSGTITCGNQSAKFSIDNSITLIVASRGRNPENPKSRESGLNTEQMLEPRFDGKTNCLTSVQKDNLVMQLNGSTESGGVQPYQQNRVYDINGISPALMAQMSCGTHAILENETKIRRLTPTECERLQTVPDGYTSCVSDTQRYRMLGNGWTVDVIAYIFSFMALKKTKSEGEKIIKTA